MAIPVDSKVVRCVELYRWKRTGERLDVWPFAVLYVSWIFIAVPKLDVTDSFIVLGAIAVLHTLTFLFSTWSVDFRCLIQTSKVKDIKEAGICKVIPETFSGSKEIVPLLLKNSLEAASALAADEVSFSFRKQQFIYIPELQKFQKLPYPCKQTFGYYGKTTGYGSDAKVQTATMKWGRNIFEFPQPTFQKLMKEHCMEPFFVFQVFCVGLWCLDEYWYYSIFTLFMLFLFESTVVKSRLRTLTDLRKVRVDSQTLMVHRGGKWVKLSGMDLLPGDVVSIGRPVGQGSEERTVPADMLLISGSAIINEALLTGESTPQWKVSIVGRHMDENMSMKRDKAHILFGGTKILQHSADKTGHLKTPDGGCLAVVLRTGFETSQGKLMRTILFSTERVTASNWESGLFICFLVIFAIVAAGYVLKKGLEDPSRSKYKLFLNCSLIITSVIPPELPMELSIAVNTSLIALARKGIFCTEPFRIPFAGKVDVCCFDKTGTLTSDDMEFRGVVTLDRESELETDTSSFPEKTVQVLAACHSLVFVDNKLVGDPLEKAALKGIEWIYTADEKAMPRKGNYELVQILQRHHFASHLKRMSTVVRVQDSYFAFVKGAPEVIQERLSEVNPRFVETYKHFTCQGSRVLALAYKKLPDLAVGELRNLEREFVESELLFAGFAVFACPLRSDSASVLAELKASSHDLVMITGDQALTACHVAREVYILSNPVLILSAKQDTGQYEWLSPDEKEKLPFEYEVVETLSITYDLCVAGDSIPMLQRNGALQLVLPFIKVFARVSPDQKELILTTLKSVGRIALMCGDGTNDVGALKQSHVGVALLNAIPPDQQASDSSSTNHSSSPSGKVKIKKSKSVTSAASGISSSVSNQSLPNKSNVVNKPVKVGFNSKSLQGSSTGQGNSSNHQLTPVEREKQKLKKLMDELNEEGDGRTPPMVKLGDASMASPFTAKHSSVHPTVDIIRQGRSTLVTTVQMFKILGLNCLATAYVLSVMYLDGVKLGDVQATISGVFTAAFFLFISHARPLDKLSAERPHANIFCAYVFLSLLGQFAIHLTFLISMTRAASEFMPEECIEPDSDFEPNLVNTVSYMANMMIQVATFAVNYMGHPFNQSVRENKAFFYALTAAAIFFTVITSDVFRTLNDWMRLVPLPQPFGYKLLFSAALMMVSCYLWEQMLRRLFPGKMPDWRKKLQHSTTKGNNLKKND